MEGERRITARVWIRNECERVIQRSGVQPEAAPAGFPDHFAEPHARACRGGRCDHARTGQPECDGGGFARHSDSIRAEHAARRDCQRRRHSRCAVLGQAGFWKDGRNFQPEYP